MKEYQEIVKRCEQQGVDITDCHVYIEPNNFDGESCLQGTLSQDGEWLCIPRKNYNESFEEEFYEPVCYQIKNSFKTYLKGDSVWYLVQCYVLYKRAVKVS